MAEPPRIWKTGERCRVRAADWDRPAVDGTILLASPNGRSLAVGFVGLSTPSGVHVHGVALMWERGAFRPLQSSDEILLEEANRG